MKIIEINNIDHLLRVVNELSNNFVFRGQANSDWSLQSSLERVIGDKWSSKKAQRFEEFSISQFKSKFHLYDRENVQPSSKLAWLSVMQHYGVPTRLLDFSESPYVALYFALEGYNSQTKASLALYAIDYSDILEKSIDLIKSKNINFRETRATVYEKQDSIFDEIVDPIAYDIVWVAEPKVLNARLDLQAGSFLLSGNRGLRLEQVLASDLYKDSSKFKYVIAPEFYEGVFALLRKMNITSKSIYGDLDGLARSIRMQMQIYVS
jgi:hypothetical protein